MLELKSGFNRRIGAAAVHTPPESAEAAPRFVLVKERLKSNAKGLTDVP
jgi:hypothetical protein